MSRTPFESVQDVEMEDLPPSNDPNARAGQPARPKRSLKDAKTSKAKMDQDVVEDMASVERDEEEALENKRPNKADREAGNVKEKQAKPAKVAIGQRRGSAVDWKSFDLDDSDGDESFKGRFEGGGGGGAGGRLGPMRDNGAEERNVRMSSMSRGVAEGGTVTRRQALSAAGSGSGAGLLLVGNTTVRKTVPSAVEADKSRMSAKRGSDGDVKVPQSLGHGLTSTGGRHEQGAEGRLEKLESYMETFFQHKADIEEALKEKTSKIEKLQKKLASLGQELETEKEKRRALEEAVEMKEAGWKKKAREQDLFAWQLKREIKAVQEEALESSRFVWKIENIMDVTGNMRPRVSPVFCSRGYSLQTILFLHQAGQQKHFSVGFRLVPGVDDDVLEWPFKRSVRFKLRPPSTSSALPLYADTPVKRLERPQMEKRDKVGKQEKEKMEEDEGKGEERKENVDAKGEEDLNTEKYELILRFVEAKELAQYVWDGSKVVIDVTVWSTKEY